MCFSKENYNLFSIIWSSYVKFEKKLFKTSSVFQFCLVMVERSVLMNKYIVK